MSHPNKQYQEAADEFCRKMERKLYRERHPCPDHSPALWPQGREPVAYWDGSKHRSERMWKPTTVTWLLLGYLIAGLICGFTVGRMR